MNFLRVIALFLVLFATFTTATPPDTPSTNLTGITSLVTRLFGPRIPSPFIFSLSNISTFGNNTYDGKPTPTLHAFELSAIQGNLIISIRGSDLISLAAGLNYYLKYYCNLQVRSWTETDADSDVDVIFTYPSPLPILPTQNVTIRTSYEWNYYMNVCTPSYTQVWWTWSRWQRELDWMALNGINMALAFTGQEKVVLKLYQDRFAKQIGYNDLTDFFGGPAFLAWARMGNIQGSWAGPLPMSWIEAQHTLQLQILDRMEELGITPVLPAFNGFVPRAVAALFPNAKIHQTQEWSRFTPPYCCDLLLDPLDPLFKEIGELYIRTQIVLYGKTRTHLYSADTFNENRPPSNDTSFLRNSSKAVYDSMRAGDKDAVWIMQAWLFVDEEFWQPPQIEALLSGVSYDGMIILDMEADARPFWNKTNHFYGHRFIWNMLHNFGGNVGLGGRMFAITNHSVSTFHNEKNHMIGVGMTPEGIHQNYIVYELMAEMFWNSDTRNFNLSTWIHNYVTRRYGLISGFASATWIGLTHNSSVYDAPATQHGVLKSYVELRPNLNMQQDGFMGTVRWYNASDVIDAVHNMLQLVPQLAGNDNYRFDLVDLMRQALADHFQSIHDTLTYAYNTKDIGKAIKCGIDALHLYQDLDRLLSSNHHFLLGRWIAAARRWSVNQTDVTPEYYEYNARNQITLWGPHGEIADYAAKQWSGLVSSFYAPRYALWIRTIIRMLSTQSELDQKAFIKQSVELEQKFQHDHTIFPTTPQTDPIQTVTELYHKYFSHIPLVSKY